MALDESFHFTTRFRGGENDDVLDETIYFARRTLEGYSVGVFSDGKYVYGVEFPYHVVIGYLNDAEWIVHHNKE